MIIYKKVARMRFIEGETEARAVNYKSKSLKVRLRFLIHL